MLCLQIASLLQQGQELDIPEVQDLPLDVQGFAGLQKFIDLIRECCRRDKYDRPTMQIVVERVNSMYGSKNLI